MSRDVSYAVRVRVEAWARATGASPDDVMGRLLDGPVRDYDGVDDYFRDLARYVPEAAEIRDWWDRAHATAATVESDAAELDAYNRPPENRDNVRRAGDVWVVRLSPEEAHTFEAMRRLTPYNRSEMIRAGLAILARELGKHDPRAEVVGEREGVGA